jgi:hypothetical protein
MILVREMPDVAITIMPNPVADRRATIGVGEPGVATP